MSLRKLPEARTFARPRNYQWDAPSDVLAKWAEQPLAADKHGSRAGRTRQKQDPASNHNELARKPHSSEYSFHPQHPDIKYPVLRPHPKTWLEG